jgi:hypothetical protein
MERRARQTTECNKFKVKRVREIRSRERDNTDRDTRSQKMMFSAGSKLRMLAKILTANRALSSTTGDLKGFPQYTLYTPECFFSLRVILPPFRILRNNVLVIDRNKKGGILLEWLPRSADGENHNNDSTVEVGVPFIVGDF